MLVATIAFSAMSWSVPVVSLNHPRFVALSLLALTFFPSLNVFTTLLQH